MTNIKHSLLIGIALFIAGTASAQNDREAGAVPAQNVSKFVGADNCKDCHNRPEKGTQYDSWLRSPHSQAVRTLSSAKATEYARNNGIANAASDQRCLKCHSTYDAVPANQRSADIKQTEGVSCEGCHGAGSNYRSAAIMRDRNLAMENGLIKQNEPQCVLCHNPESPFYKEFDFKNSIEKVRHSNPARIDSRAENQLLIINR